MPDIPQKILRILRRFKLRPEGVVSYAQSGEDLIIAGLLKSFGIRTVRYLDIGAYDPVRLSNTYFFYENGHRGVCVEPNPVLADRIRRRRSRDVVLNLGVGTKVQDTSAPFYSLDPATLSTFSKHEADKLIADGSAKLVETRPVQLETAESIIATYLHDAPSFVSLDVEGLDADILRTFNFAKYRPAIWCIETVTYSRNNQGIKEKEIFDIMAQNGYTVYADTYVNTIFVDSRKQRG